MSESFPTSLRGMLIVDAKRAWPLVAVRGGLAILFGLITLVWPALTLLALAVVFGVYAIVDGVGAIWEATRPGDRAHRWAYVALGVLGIIAGVFVLGWPHITVLALGVLVGVWALVTGISEIGAAIRLRRQITGEVFLIIAGVLSVLAGLLILVHPIAGVFGIALLIGIYALVYGIMLFVLAFRLRRLGAAE